MSLNTADNEELDMHLVERLQQLGKKNHYKELDDFLHSGIRIDLVDLKIAVSNERRLFLRQGVVERLVKAQRGLPAGYRLVIRDAFRSVEVVRALYDRYMAIAQEKEGLSQEEADLKIRNLLAMPDDPVPPGHMTGGALDVILSDDNGRLVPLSVDETMIPRDRQMFTFCSELPPAILKERHVLYDAMIEAGFSNYFREYWHYSYGDAYWAMRRKQKTALYGLPPENLFSIQNHV